MKVFEFDKLRDLDGFETEDFRFSIVPAESYAKTKIIECFIYDGPGTNLVKKISMFDTTKRSDHWYVDFLDQIKRITGYTIKLKNFIYNEAKPQEIEVKKNKSKYR